MCFYIMEMVNDMREQMENIDEILKSPTVNSPKNKKIARILAKKSRLKYEIITQIHFHSEIIA